MKDELVSFILHPSSFILSFKRFLVKIHQFDRRHRGLEPLVALLCTRAIDRLLERVRGDDAIDHGHAGLHAGLRDPFGNFAGDVFEVRRLSANDRAETNHRIILSRTRKLERQQRNLKRAGNLVKFNRLLVGAQTIERIERAFDQPRSNEIVPTTGNQREAKTFGIQASLMCSWLQDSSIAPSRERAGTRAFAV